jgi:amino acid adenylation domain-containing protein
VNLISESDKNTYTVATKGTEEEFLAAVCHVLGRGAIVAVGASDCGTGLLEHWMPIRAAEGVPSGALPPLRDMALRHPELAGLANWPCLVAARVSKGGLLRPMQPGTIAFGPDRQLRQCGAAAMANAVASAMSGNRMLSAGLIRGSPLVLQMIAAQALSAPDAPAIEEGGHTISRHDLSRRAERWAERLLATGLHQEDGVGVLLPPGIDFVAAALGTMLAGGAYVPLNLASPAERRRVEVAEAGVTHIITSQSRATTLSSLNVTLLADDDTEVEGLSPSLPTVTADDCAYRIFTSGSSGRPKAVEVAHAALGNLIAHYLQALPMGSGDRMTMLAHTTFDASVADVWPILAAGGTLLVPPPRILLDPAGLIEWLVSNRSTCAFVPTIVAERVLMLRWPQDSTLHTLLTGGDVLYRRPPSGLPFRLVNTYGPTENTVDSLWSTIGPGSGQPSIGRPIGGVWAAIIDGAGNTVAEGEIGELVLGGAQLARGYYGRPQLTAEYFDHDGTSGVRRYRTGDRARINSEGEFEFHGRMDRQVQLLGIRVEPGEIESLLRAHHAVREAVCLPQYAGEQVTGLIAHVVPIGSISADGLAENLRTMLAAHLPPEITPKAVVLCNEIPRTVAGKVDRNALQAEDQNKNEGDVLAVSDPIGVIWRRLLPRSAGAPEEQSLWDLGGDSLMAMNLLLELDTALKVRVPIAHFLADPTLAGLKRIAGNHISSTVVQLRKGKGRPLVCWYGLSGDLEEYQQFLQKQIGDRSIYAVISPAIINETRLPRTLEEAATTGLAALKQAGLSEPPALLGYSWGGLLAFEAARQLTIAGTPPPFVGLVGTHPPVTRRSRLSRAAHLVRWAPVSLWRRATAKRPPEKLRVTLGRLAWLFSGSGSIPPPLTWPKPIFEAHVRMGFQYLPLPIVPVSIHLFRDNATRKFVDHYGYLRYDKSDLGWAKWAENEPTVQWLEGSHLSQLTGPFVNEFVTVLARELAAIDRIGPS